MRLCSATIFRKLSTRPHVLTKNTGNRDNESGSKTHVSICFGGNHDRELLPKSLLILILGFLALPFLIALYSPETRHPRKQARHPGALTVIDATGNRKRCVR